MILNFSIEIGRVDSSAEQGGFLFYAAYEFIIIQTDRQTDRQSEKAFAFMHVRKEVRDKDR